MSYMSFWSVKSAIIPEGSKPIDNNMRKSRVKPRFIRFS